MDHDPEGHQLKVPGPPDGHDNGRDSWLPVVISKPTTPHLRQAFHPASNGHRHLVAARHRVNRYGLGVLALDAMMPGALAGMPRTGVQRAWLLPVAKSPKRLGATNDCTLQQCAANRALVPFASLHPDGAWRAELSRLRAAGIAGIKMRLALQMDAPCHAFQRCSMLEACERAHLVVVNCSHFDDEVGSWCPGGASRAARGRQDVPAVSISGRRP
jgi:hypothetical protein